MNEDYKGLYAAIILSALVVWGVNYFFPKPVEPVVTEAQEVTITPQPAEENTAATQEDAEEKEEEKLPSAAEVMAQDARLPIKNAVISGSVRLKGARFDNLTLAKYKETLDAGSPDVSLLLPAKTANAYFADYGWLSADATIKVPNAETVWTVVGNAELTPDTPVTLEWNNGQGIKFINQISLDEHYLFELKQKVENNSGKSVTLLPYGLFSKRIDEKNRARSVVHEGFVGVLNGKLKEIRYEKLKDEPQEFETVGEGTFTKFKI